MSKAGERHPQFLPLRERVLSSLGWEPATADHLALRVGIFDELGDEEEREELRAFLREMHQAGEIGAVLAGDRWVLFAHGGA
jgi:hypothetical protein